MADAPEIELKKRIEAAEAAIVALGAAEFGDVEGHPFRGNQYSGGYGKQSDERAARRERIKAMSPEEKAALIPKPPAKPLTDAAIYGRRKTTEQHYNEIEKRVNEAKKDFPDVADVDLYHDIGQSYIEHEVRPADRAEIYRTTGIGAPDPRPWNERGF